MGNAAIKAAVAASLLSRWIMDRSPKIVCVTDEL
jgi:hypothetical protein